MMTKKILIFTSAICTLSFFSCTDSKTEKTTEDEIADTLNVAKDTVVAEEDNDVSYNLPSALQIAYVFRKSGSAYNATLPNNKANVTKYNTSNYKRAANFGVYSSDLAYCLFNKKYQESKDYLKTLKDIGASLSLNQAFETDNLAERFDKNISNEDSIVKIVSSVQLKTDVLLEQNKQKHVTVIAFVGAWIESAYIAAEVYNKDKNKKALASLLEQTLLSETIIKALHANQKSEPEMANLIVAVEKINTSFNGIASIKTVVEKDEEFDFAIIKVTDEEFNALKQSITELRKSIVD
jgi:DNA-binding XRE family transcriptional regulator